MKLERLDALSLPGDADKANEDAFAYRDRAAVVLDGATSLGGRLLPGPSDAAWLARFGANRIMFYLGEEATIRGAVTASMFDAHESFERLRRREPVDRYEIPYASLMLAVAGEGFLDFAWLGDCAAIVAGPGAGAETVGEAIAKRSRESARVKRLADSQGEAPAAVSVRETFLPALRAARNQVNTPKGGYLFGPDVTAADHLRHTRIEIGHGACVLLASDGFLALVGDYGRYTIESLIGAAARAGLAALGKELRAIEADDPEGRLYPRFKKSDDATAVLLKTVA